MHAMCFSMHNVTEKVSNKSTGVKMTHLNVMQLLFTTAILASYIHPLHACDQTVQHILHLLFSAAPFQTQPLLPKC